MCRHLDILHRELGHLQILESKGGPGSNSQGCKGQLHIACYLSLLLKLYNGVSVYFVTTISFIPRT